MAGTSRTPYTEHVLNLPQGNLGEARIKKVTKGHEILDVSGFTLKRRKTQGPLAVAQNAGPSSNELSQPLKTPHSRSQGGPSATCSRTPHVDEHFISEELYHRLSRSLEGLSETATAMERLNAVCSSVCDAEVDIATKGGDGAMAVALADVFSAFAVSVVGAVQEGAIGFAQQAAGGGWDQVNEEDLKVDLQARKAGLKARLQKFTEEEAEWEALLAKVEALDVQRGGGAAEEQEQGAVGEGAAPVAPSAEVAALRQLHRDVHRRLALQADGICLLVGDVEELVERANRSAQAMQAQYHAQKFKTFPHVNSPAHLIKALVRPVAAPVAALEES